MPTKIACIGDSITYGFPYNPEQSWVYLASKSTKLNLLNIGVNGDTTGKMAYRFSNDVLNINPS